MPEWYLVAGFFLGLFCGLGAGLLWAYLIWRHIW